MNKHCILPLSYFGSVEYYGYFTRHEKVSLEYFEYFEKQTIRSYMAILGPNGVQKLSVPVKDRGKKIIVKDIKVSNGEPWQRVHLQSIITAYSSSPYFEYYQDYVTPLYNKKWDYLIDLNIATTDIVRKLLKLQTPTETTTCYAGEYQKETTDLRIHPSFKKYQITERHFKPYIQVFGDKYGFIPNLSVLDLLFNVGPQTKEYL